MRLSAIGLAVGVAAALVLTRLMATMLLGVGPADPLTYAAMTVLFLAIAALAAWLPAHRAAALDPVLALRGE
jgi:ABC-type antimicrobial peptide transport system permease subunit